MAGPANNLPHPACRRRPSLPSASSTYATGYAFVGGPCEKRRRRRTLWRRFTDRPLWWSKTVGSNGPSSSDQALCHRSTAREGVLHHPLGRVLKSLYKGVRPLVVNALTRHFANERTPLGSLLGTLPASCVGNALKIPVPGRRDRENRHGGLPRRVPPPTAASSASKRVPPYPPRGPGGQT